jgi:hypothetical protein
MWTLAASIFFACKILTRNSVDTRAVPAWRQWTYVLAWPGMNAARFFGIDSGTHVDPPTVLEWGRAVANVVAGVLVFWTAQYWAPNSTPLLLGWAGMIGVVLMLHFGFFHLLSCFWRSRGIDAPPLMNRPTQSTSVVEFWGRRWNTAFRDLTYQFLFRPLRPRVGAVAALIIGFLLSGIIHDVVISLPAEGGYGGPTLVFLIQAAAILFERSSPGRVLGLARGWRGWLFVALVLLLPVRLLFHDHFVMRIMLPFMQALGAA